MKSFENLVKTTLHPPNDGQFGNMKHERQMMDDMIKFGRRYMEKLSHEDKKGLQHPIKHHTHSEDESSEQSDPTDRTSALLHDDVKAERLMITDLPDKELELDNTTGRDPSHGSECAKREQELEYKTMDACIRLKSPQSETNQSLLQPAQSQPGNDFQSQEPAQQLREIDKELYESNIRPDPGSSDDENMIRDLKNTQAVVRYLSDHVYHLRHQSNAKGNYILQLQRYIKDLNQIYIQRQTYMYASSARVVRTEWQLEPQARQHV
jgi:hypothetical protein